MVWPSLEIIEEHGGGGGGHHRRKASFFPQSRPQHPSGRREATTSSYGRVQAPKSGTLTGLLMSIAASDHVWYGSHIKVRSHSGVLVAHRPMALHQQCHTTRSSVGTAFEAAIRRNRDSMHQPMGTMALRHAHNRVALAYHCTHIFRDT